MAAPSRERIRDAKRSRAAIMSAAERLFSERGYDGASLSDIGAAAGLSRGAPGYFFASKQRLYAEALAAAFASRQEATARAFAPVRAWCASEAAGGRAGGGTGGPETLREGLRSAAADYMAYLAEHPAFIALIMREELDGGRRLSGVSRASTAMQDAFAGVRRAALGRGLASFDVEEAVLTFVALTFTPFSLRRTLMQSLGLELNIGRHAEVVADQLMNLLGA
jgi:AcrR family transcriptional regulator